MIRRVAWCACLVAALTTPPPVSGTTPSQPGRDDDFRRPRVEELSVGAFAMHLEPPLPIRVVGIVENRQIHLGRPVYAVTAQNVTDEVIGSYTLAAAVVSSDGTVKAVQRLEAVSNLKAGQARQQNLQLRVALPSISDRVAFVVVDLKSADGKHWSLPPDRLSALLKEARPRR